MNPPSSYFLIPREKAIKEALGGGGPFWKNYWDKFNDEELYQKRINRLENDIHKVVEEASGEKIYIEVNLDETETEAKSKKPYKIWEQLGMEVIGAYEECSYIVSGGKTSFEKVLEITKDSTFNKAKRGSGNDRDIAREVFAMKGMSDLTKNIDRRMDRELLRLGSENYTGKIPCIIEIHSDENFSEYENLWNDLHKEVTNGISKRAEDLFIHNMSFLGELTFNEIQQLLIKFAYIRKVYVQPTVKGGRLIPGTDFSSIKLEPSETSIVVGLFDSGIDSPVFDSCVVRRKNHLMSHQTPDKRHGTMVASKILFGEGIFDQTASGGLSPLCNLVDIQVLHGSNARWVGLEEFKKAVKEAFKTYNEVDIYNLSMSYDCEVDEEDVDELTEFFDEVLRENDKIVVCSVGNHELYKGAYGTAEQMFNDLSLASKIAVPSDALNLISVGSVCSLDDTSCLTQKKKFPSPFTRKGGIRKFWRKPELVHVGGNIEIDHSYSYSDTFLTTSARKHGVEVMEKDSLSKEVGTSFSAPLVTRECVKILDYIKKTNLGDLTEVAAQKNRANLVKSLLIHSTTFVEQADIPDEETKKAYGFGVPNFETLLQSEANQSRIIYTGKIDKNMKKQKIRLDLPSFLGNKPIEGVFTFVYNPPVDKNFATPYKMLSLKPNLRLVAPAEYDAKTGEIIKYKEVGKLKPSKKDSKNAYRNFHGAFNHFNTVHYCFKNKALNSLTLEILITLNMTKELEKKYKHKDFEQSYSLVLTLKDPQGNNKLLEALLESQQFNIVQEKVRVY